MRVMNQEKASSSAECSRDKPPFSFVRGQDSTMWDIVWVSPQGHRSVSVSCHFLLQTPVSLFRAKTPNQNDKPGTQILWIARLRSQPRGKTTAPFPSWLVESESVDLLDSHQLHRPTSRSTHTNQLLLKHTHSTSSTTAFLGRSLRTKTLAQPQDMYVSMFCLSPEAEK